MKAVAAVILGTLTIATSAHAGGYVAAGLGSSPTLGGELEEHLDTSGHSAGRVAIGHGMGPIAIEAGLGGFGVHGVAPSGEWIDGSALSVGLSVKGSIGLVGPIDGYGRAGLERTWIRSDMMEDLDGEGYLIGAGLELGLPMVIPASLWLEVDRELLVLAQPSGDVRGTADTLLAGVRVGI